MKKNPAVGRDDSPWLRWSGSLFAGVRHGRLSRLRWKQNNAQRYLEALLIEVRVVDGTAIGPLDCGLSVQGRLFNID